jgi:hypothetical protein
MLIALDFHSDWFFKCFSLPDLEYQGNLVRQGRGPDEEMELFPYFRTYGEDGILFQTEETVKIVRVVSTHNGLGLEVIVEHELPESMYDDMDLFLLDGQLFSSLSYRPSTRDFRAYCLTTGQMFEWGEMLPIKTKGVPDHHIPMLFAKLTTVKPDRKLLATVYGMLPIIRIYDAEKGELLSEMQVADFSNNERKLFNKSSAYVPDGLINYYFRVKSTNDYIYALFSGQPSVQLSFEGGRPVYTDNASEIHIWKWDGTPVMKLELERPVFSFDVTPDNKTIIASSIVDVDKFFRAEIPWD